MGLEHEDEIEEVHPKIQVCKRVVGIINQFSTFHKRKEGFCMV